MDTRAKNVPSVDTPLDSAVLDPALARAAASAPFRALDHAKEAFMARLTSGVSPAAMTLAFADWLIHLSAAPGKQLELAALSMQNAQQLANYAGHAVFCGHPPALTDAAPSDSRFNNEAWQTEPYRLWQQAFLLTEQWWETATREVPGTMHHHEDVVSFTVRQLLDVVAPSNFPGTNPEVAQRTAATLGANLWQGARNAFEDAQAKTRGPVAGEVAQFKVGVDVAATPGKVVFSNHLIELIQYSPSTGTVLAEPLLIVPAWIMKYYILDLTPHNSMIGYLVGQGHTVFCLSWRNVSAEDRDLSLDDYRQLGVMAALDAVGQIVPDRKIHAIGYCLGGTLLSIVAAAMAGVGDERLGSVTLLAAQTDFTEPGELQLFIDDSEVYFLESMMWSQGYLSADQMSGAFQLLESNNLIWSRIVHDYLLGERTPVSDLMAWDSDSTRMPYRMHAEYLRQLFLNNDLACGRYSVAGRAVSIHDIAVPMFVVSTERDHIAPWQSVYKINTLTDAEITFVLTSGGHNAGIVSEPGHARRHFRIQSRAAGDLHATADEWLAAAQPEDGSWWPKWTEWLAAHSSTEQVAAAKIGLPNVDPATLIDAPGSYIFQH